jgi:hypothetical protein
MNKNNPANSFSIEARKEAFGELKPVFFYQVKIPKAPHFLMK